MAETVEEARERLRPYVQRTASLKGVMFEASSRLIGSQASWDYMVRARELVQRANSVLDMGTGDGWRFTSICTGFGGRAVATEEWATSASIAAPLFQTLGINLARCRSHFLPFVDICFDVVLNRHEELTPEEVARVLRPGGSFLTQQCWPFWEEIRRFFPRGGGSGDLYSEYLNGLKQAGLAVLDARSAKIVRAYSGVGDIITMVLLDGSLIPDFDPLGSDLKSVLDMERELTTPEGLVLSEGSFIIEALKR